jgi:3-hydroxybutyryl-CoA dehydratase
MTNPHEYSFEDIIVGQNKIFEVVVIESMVNAFAKISGDYNPLHMDVNYAQTTKFEKKVCHGLLLASFFSQLIGMYLPGKNALYLSQTLNFISPCYVNDKIIIKGEVLKKSLSTKILTLKTEIFDIMNNCIVDGEAKVIVR